MRIPKGAREVLDALKKAGYEAYLVGGCVRDMLIANTEDGMETHDWDICTNATPEQMKTAFAGYRTVDTGIKHGTITVLASDGQYEVTTYRIDGIYSDGRHPDSVKFTDQITEDLSRRDFTINAMAVGADADGKPTGLVDPFGGQEDLARKCLRCVGNPEVRLEEDALRILRAIRFASRLALEIDRATHDAMLEKRMLLQKISVERIMDELSKILMTEHGFDYLRKYREILTVILPEMCPCIDFAQNNPWHCYSVFDHMMISVGYAPKDLTLRMAMMLHDIGKPVATSVDEAGVHHFYGHAEISAEMAERILRRCHCSKQLIHDVTELVRMHDVEIKPSARMLRRLLSHLGETQMRRLIQMKQADTMAQSEKAKERKLSELNRSEELLEQIIAQKQAVTLKDLAINGKDLREHGVPPGPEMGACLQKALDAVLDGTTENEREALLQIALEAAWNRDGERPAQSGQ